MNYSKCLQQQLLIALSMVLLFLCGMPAALAAKSVAGRWNMFDDELKQPCGVVAMTTTPWLQGILQQFSCYSKAPVTIDCMQCHSATKHALLSKPILFDLHARGHDVSYEGIFINPVYGNRFRCIVSLLPQAQALRVRTYIGLPLFGREVVWNRAQTS